MTSVGRSVSRSGFKQFSCNIFRLWFSAFILNRLAFELPHNSYNWHTDIFRRLHQCVILFFFATCAFSNQRLGRESIFFCLFWSQDNYLLSAFISTLSSNVVNYTVASLQEGCKTALLCCNWQSLELQASQRQGAGMKGHSLWWYTPASHQDGCIFPWSALAQTHILD